MAVTEGEDADADEGADAGEDEDEDVRAVDADARPDVVPDPSDLACTSGRFGTAAGPVLAKPRFEKSSGAMRLLFSFREI